MVDQNSEQSKYKTPEPTSEATTPDPQPTPSKEESKPVAPKEEKQVPAFVSSASKPAPKPKPTPTPTLTSPPEAKPSSQAAELVEKVVFINRCSKVVKGGRRFSFSALVVSGDYQGKAGYGFGKANEVAECIRKASDSAKLDLVSVPLTDTGSIPHEIYAEFGGAKVLLKPASPGTGVIAGGGVRAVCEVAGVKDVLSKSLGSNNAGNVVKATLKALSLLRSKETIMKSRGRKKEKAI